MYCHITECIHSKNTECHDIVNMNQFLTDTDIRTDVTLLYKCSIKKNTSRYSWASEAKFPYWSNVSSALAVVNNGRLCKSITIIYTVSLY